MAALALMTMPTLNSEAMARGKQVAHGRAHAYFVPPPPAYCPSYVPELQRRTSAEALVATETTSGDSLIVSDSSSSYVRAKDGYQDPKAVHANKYVTYWNQK